MISPAEWLARLEEHRPVAREGRDPEGVHQVRVSAGRLDVWLRLGRWAVLRDDLRWLRRRASDVRDLDVLLAGDPPPAWRPWLRRRRAAVHERLVAALDSPRLRALLRALGSLPPLEESVAREGVGRLARKALAAGERLEGDSADVGNFHALRRRLRRLRYGIEWVGEEADELELLQDAFGALNDLAVVRRLVAEYRARSRLADWTAGIETRLAAARERALAIWLEQRQRVRARAEC